MHLRKGFHLALTWLAIGTCFRFSQHACPSPTRAVHLNSPDKQRTADAVPVVRDRAVTCGRFELGACRQKQKGALEEGMGRSGADTKRCHTRWKGLELVSPLGGRVFRTACSFVHKGRLPPRKYLHLLSSVPIIAPRPLSINDTDQPVPYGHESFRKSGSAVGKRACTRSDAQIVSRAYSGTGHA